MIKVIPINHGAVKREEIFDQESQRTLGCITSFGPSWKGSLRGDYPSSDLWAAYANVPVTTEHQNGRHVVTAIESRQEAIDLVITMHRYWTLPAFEKEKET